MERWRELEALAARARDEQAPRVDVTRRVLRSLDGRGAGRQAAPRIGFEERPLFACTAGALLAASVVTLLAANAWITLDDPLADLLAGWSLLAP